MLSLSFFEGREQTFEGGNELLDPHPFAWKTSTPLGGLQTPVSQSLCSFFSPEYREYNLLIHQRLRLSKTVGALDWARQKEVTLVCSYLFQFSPFSSDLLRLPAIDSIVFRVNRNNTEQTHFCRPLFANPELGTLTFFSVTRSMILPAGYPEKKKTNMLCSLRSEYST